MPDPHPEPELHHSASVHAPTDLHNIHLNGIQFLSYIMHNIVTLTIDAHLWNETECLYKCPLCLENLDNFSV